MESKIRIISGFELGLVCGGRNKTKCDVLPSIATDFGPEPSLSPGVQRSEDPTTTCAAYQDRHLGMLHTLSQTSGYAAHGVIDIYDNVCSIPRCL